jgi:cell division protein FtsQ
MALYSNHRLNKNIIKGISLASISLLLALAIYTLMSLPLFKIKNIIIYNNNILVKKQLFDQINIHENTSIFNFSKRNIRQKLLLLPQIYRVKIKKKLPNTIEIKIFERKPFANIITPFHNAVIDREGIILNNKFVKIANITSLPIIKSHLIETSSANVKIDAFHVNFIVNTIDNLGKFLPNTQIQIKISKYSNVTVLLDDILTLNLGDVSQINKKFSSFKKLIPYIGNDWNKISYIDLKAPKYPIIKRR